MGLAPAHPIVVGRITTVHGVRGWLKIQTSTEPPENIFTYTPWWISTKEGWIALEFDEYRTTAKGLMVHLVGIDDRDEARQYCQHDIQVEKSQLPPLTDGEFYWHQLEGLVVNTVNGVRLGTVNCLMETGANDVLVVKGDALSIDGEERLIPYVSPFVTAVSLEQQTIQVDWDPEF